MIVRLVSIEQDGVIRIAANGPITVSELTDDDHQPLIDVAGEHWSRNRVLLGMADADYIDSTAIGWLLSCHKQAERDGGRIVLHSVPPRVQEIFDMLRVNRVLPCARDENEALQLVRGETS